MDAIQWLPLGAKFHSTSATYVCRLK